MPTLKYKNSNNEWGKLPFTRVFTPNIQLRTGTTETWATETTFVPLKGEPIFFKDVNQLKIGDGVTLLSNLPFLSI